MKRSERNTLNLGCALLAILALTSPGSFAQTSIDSCNASPEDRQFEAELAKSPDPIELLRDRIAADPNCPGLIILSSNSIFEY
jgi:hypothetical protein